MHHPQPQSCQTRIWAPKNSQSVPQRFLCKMPSASTERAITSAPATHWSRARVGSAACSPGSHTALLPAWCLGDNPGPQSGQGQRVHGGCPPGQWGQIPLSWLGGRQAGFKGPSRAVTLGLRPRPLLFPGLTTVEETGLGHSHLQCKRGPGKLSACSMVFILSRSCSSIRFPTERLCVGMCPALSVPQG